MQSEATHELILLHLPLDCLCAELRFLVLQRMYRLRSLHRQPAGESVPASVPAEGHRSSNSHASSSLYVLAVSTSLKQKKTNKNKAVFSLSVLPTTPLISSTIAKRFPEVISTCRLQLLSAHFLWHLLYSHFSLLPLHDHCSCHLRLH